MVSYNQSVRSISEGLCGCFLSILREKSIPLWFVLQFMLIYLSFFAVEHVVLDVLHSFQAVSGWKSGKMVRDLSQAQKEIPIFMRLKWESNKS